MSVVKAIQYNLSIGELIIKSAQLEDSEEIITFIKQVEGETRFLMRETGEFNKSIDHERRFIEDKLKNDMEIFLIAKINGKIVGTLGFATIPFNRYKHKGHFGISIMKEFWDYGIGYNLITSLITWADNAGIIKITLEVDSDNFRAINLYEKFEFVQEGVLKYDKYLGDETYIDSIIMSRVNMRMLNIPDF